MAIINNISEEIKQFNKQLLSTDWKESDIAEQVIRHIPEWKRLLGCKQHKIHDFCLDEHTFLVLRYIQKHKDYENLSEENKLILLYSGLLHDIEKIENEVDTEHPAKGAKLSSIILYRLGFSEDFINAVYLMIRYHQVLGFTISGKINLSDNEFYNMFKEDNIVDLQAILSMADIKSVKKDEALYKPEMEEKFEELKRKIKFLIKERKKGL